MTRAATEWTLQDNVQASVEGWAIFECDGSENGPQQLCRDDESAILASDDVAWAFVISRAGEGSAFHRRALLHIASANPQEFGCMLSTHPEISPAWFPLEERGAFDRRGMRKVARQLRGWSNRDPRAAMIRRRAANKLEEFAATLN